MDMDERQRNLESDRNRSKVRTLVKARSVDYYVSFYEVFFLFQTNGKTFSWVSCFISIEYIQTYKYKYQKMLIIIIVIFSVLSAKFYCYNLRI